MPIAPEYYTADMVRTLPDDGQRYEVVYGELLVTPSPAVDHQHIVLELGARLRDYCNLHGVGRPFVSPADISWGQDILVQPDVFVVPREEAREGVWTAVRTLLLVAEVLSPSTARHDRFQKRKLYQSHDVATLWLVDTERKIVEVWTPEATFPAVERERATWHPVGAAEPLVIPLVELFALA